MSEEGEADRRSLTIVVPAYNEATRLPRALDALRDFAEARPEPVEVIVVDDGSTDDTFRIATTFAAGWPRLRVIRSAGRHGKGAAVRQGIVSSNGQSVAFSDADLAVPLAQLHDLIADLTYADAAIVSRALSGARLLRRQSRIREAFGKLYARLVGLLLLRGVPDAQCGLKAYRGDVGRAIFADARENGVLFDTEVLLLLTLRGGSIAQRPAIWIHDPDSRIRLNLASSIGIFVALIRIKLQRRILLPVRAKTPSTRPSRNDFHVAQPNRDVEMLQSRP